MIASLIDTSVLIYATLADDPRCEQAREVVLGPDERWGRRHVSTQNLAEMYSNLTGPRMSRPDSPEEAARKVASVGRPAHITVLPVTLAVVSGALRLCSAHDIRRQVHFDAQLVAVMAEYGLARIYTENTADFAALAGAAGIDVVNPFTS